MQNLKDAATRVLELVAEARKRRRPTYYGRGRKSVLTSYRDGSKYPTEKTRQEFSNPPPVRPARALRRALKHPYAPWKDKGARGWWTYRGQRRDAQFRRGAFALDPRRA